MSELPFEWFMLLLRVMFVFLLYFFVYQVISVLSRELHAAATPDDGRLRRDDVSGALMVTEPGESDLTRGEVYELDPVTVIGRHPRATIVIDSTFISSEHAQITWEQGRWWVTDLRSTNGTFVNGSQIRAATGIRPGDSVELGGIRFQLVT
ncbi:MAG TPA: FHA domain-containing protein [Thermomicrobiales bacterium]|nr:FHA domain-containing protein [Thermomicrobiales bacterium]